MYKPRRHVFRIIGFLFALVLPMSQVSPAMANSLPTATWLSPSQNATVAGDFSLVAAASRAIGSSARISKWCFSLAGDRSAFSPNYAQYQWGGNYWYETGIQSDGCFSSDYALDKVRLIFRTSSWKTGSYTFSARAFDSRGFMSETISRTLQVNNTPPSPSWVSPAAGSRVTGEFSLTAKASVATGSSASISKWCFTVSGQEEVGLPLLVYYTSAFDEYGTWSASSLGSDGCFSRANSNQVRLDFDSTEWGSGLFTFTASAADSLGLVSPVIERTLHSGNGAPTVVWNANLDGNSIWRSGYWAPVGGKLLRGGGPLPKTVSLRAWQHRKGWTSWKSVKVSSTGKYSTSFYAESNLKIQIKVPTVSGYPGTSDSVNVPIYGTVSVTGPSKANAGSTFFYKLRVSPKWLSSITCNLTITRYDAGGYQIGTWYYQPKIKLSNGYGTLRQNLYKNSRSSMNCDTGNSVLTESTGSSDYISTTIR
jgi:hypothetical protein